jgi:hypothetical protein
MHERPLLPVARPDRDRLHAAAACGAAVARALVDVHAPQAERAVIAVRGAEGSARDLRAAVLTPERVGLGFAARSDGVRVGRPAPEAA